MNKLEKLQARISVILKLLIGLLIVITAVRHEFFLMGSSIFVLFLTFMPAIISRSFSIRLPIEIDFVVTVLLYLHYVLGEYNDFYLRFWWWDIFLHWGNSLILGFIGFIMAYSLLYTSRIYGKPLFAAVFSLSFAVFIGVIWEIFEFSMDYFFGFNMQKSGLVDTMTDLMMDVMGALLVSILGFFYIKKADSGMFEELVIKFLKYDKL